MSTSSRTAGIVSKLSGFSTCELSDALVKLQVPSGGHIPDIHRVSSRSGDGTDSGGTLCGPAYTVKMVSGSDHNAPRLLEHFVDTAEDGSVIVIDAPPQAKNAVWGGLMTAGASARGALGVIISGRCRDLAEQDGSGFPVFARGHSTLGQSPYTRPSAIQIPLTIYAQPRESNFPPTVVEPGDIVIGDDDGVVCVPKELVEKVLDLAQKGREVDEKCLEDITAGLGVQASFRKHRGA